MRSWRAWVGGGLLVAGLAAGAFWAGGRVADRTAVTGPRP